MPELTSQLSTALADRYRIERHLGEGGMATVFLAHDVKHDRKVALKVLRPELAAVIGAERFLNEIKVTANLQHPHILPLHDSGEAGSFLYYVMPFVAGETLRERLNREKQFAIDDAIEITRAVAAALDYAHRQGVVHRDIKPENILLHDGQALIADFGIALAVSEASGRRLTETGLSIGTPHYMSPEQAMGDRELDARSDVYSLGAMLYEMLAGDPPYTGSTAQAIVAKVITERPAPITTHRDTVPPHVAAAITKALAKLPADRFTTAAKFAEALANPGFTLATTVTAQARTADARATWDRVTVALAAVAAIAVVLGALGWLRTADRTAGRAVRFEITPAAAERFNSTTGVDVAFSPDGSAFVYRGGEGAVSLYVRKVDELEARPIPGTQGGSQPFFSPDGQWIGFFVNGEMKKVPAVGGPPLPITAAGTTPFLGASWGPNDVIVYGASDGTLRRVSSAGGNGDILASPDTTQGETSLRWPEVLPGGRHVLVTLFNELATARIGVVSMESGAITRLQEAGVNPHYAGTGHLVYTRSDGSVVAVPFDAKRLVTKGQAFPVLGGVITGSGGAAELALSASGGLVYVPGAAAEGRKLALVDRSGKETLMDDRPGGYGSPRFSPTGDRVAVPIDGHIWLYDVAQRTLEVRTFEGEDNTYPSWTPDGTAIVFSSGRPSGRALYRVPADGSAPAELLHGGPNPIWESSISRDGKWLAYRETAANTARDIMVMALDGGTKAPTPFVQTPFEERNPAISPDGRWLAYTSDQSGRDEIYVRAFPQPGGQTQVSVEGGVSPVWSRDGNELYYRSPGGMMAARVVGTPTFRVTERARLFDDTRYASSPNSTFFDVHPRIGSFLLVAARDEVTSLVVVVHWVEELKRDR